MLFRSAWNLGTRKAYDHRCASGIAYRTPEIEKPVDCKVNCLAIFNLEAGGNISVEDSSLVNQNCADVERPKPPAPEPKPAPEPEPAPEPDHEEPKPHPTPLPPDEDDGSDIEPVPRPPGPPKPTNPWDSLTDGQKAGVVGGAVFFELLLMIATEFRHWWKFLGANVLVAAIAVAIYVIVLQTQY